MKTTLNLAGTIAIATLLLASCEEDWLNNASPSTDSARNARLHESMQNPDDDEDERMNDCLYMLATSFKYVVDQGGNSLMETVYDEANANDDYEVKYYDLVDENSDFKTLINSELLSLYYENKPSSFDALDTIVNDSMIYNQQEYYPVLYVVNIRTANTSLDPVIAIGADAGDNDEVITFTKGTEGWIEGTMTEVQALASSAPVVIFTNATSAVDNTILTTTVTYNNSGVTPTASSRDYDWSSYKIKAGYRYESGWFHNNASDMHYLFTMFTTNTSNYLITSTGQFAGGAIDDKIDAISKTDVNNSTLFTTNKPLSLVNIPETDCQTYDKIYCTVYEKDWYAGKKTIGNCNTSLLFDHRARMKYPNEWYINFICDLDQLTYLAYVGSSPAYENSKAFVSIERMQ